MITCRLVSKISVDKDPSNTIGEVRLPRIPHPQETIILDGRHILNVNEVCYEAGRITTGN